MAARRSKRLSKDVLDRLEDLERRVARLEAKLRSAPKIGSAGIVETGKAGKRRPRCPGCTLELPPGRRGESCVWCGFRFDAVRGLLR